jgi:hypothetical protein
MFSQPSLNKWMSITPNKWQNMTPKKRLNFTPTSPAPNVAKRTTTLLHFELDQCGKRNALKSSDSCGALTPPSEHLPASTAEESRAANDARCQPKAALGSQPLKENVGRNSSDKRETLEMIVPPGCEQCWKFPTCEMGKGEGHDSA